MKAEGSRKQSTVVACPIIFGSIAFYLGKKADEFATHKWTLFVRGPNGEDISCFIEKVVFNLHPSFAVPVREIREPPFEVSESGWGEFEAGIFLHFRDPEEPPIDLIHVIKLYHVGSQSNLLNPKKSQPVVSEFYDEIVFTNPKEDFFKMLMMYTPRTETNTESKQTVSSQAMISNNSSRSNRTNSGPINTPYQDYLTVFDEAPDVELLVNIQSRVHQDIDEAKAQLLTIESRIAQVLGGQQLQVYNNKLNIAALKQQQQQSSEGVAQSRNIESNEGLGAEDGLVKGKGSKGGAKNNRKRSGEGGGVGNKRKKGKSTESVETGSIHND